MIFDSERKNQGFTLVEVAIVTVLLAVLVLGVMTFFTTQKRNASINSQIVDVQQITRLLGDLLEQDIRHAGLLVPESAAFCAIARSRSKSAASHGTRSHGTIWHSAVPKKHCAIISMDISIATDLMKNRLSASLRLFRRKAQMFNHRFSNSTLDNLIDR